MQQTSILNFVVSDDAVRYSADSPLFVDFFCGLGGASKGALDAGYKVVLAVDSDEKVLDIHKRNHPTCRHVCQELSEQSDVELFPVQMGQRWHLHGSPPCTKVSKANQSRRDHDRHDALQILKWFVKFAMASSAASWSMEQVATPIVLENLERIKQDTSTRKRFDFEVINFSDYGVPQNRKRVIAGSPRLVAGIRRLRKWHRSTKDVISEPRGTHVRNYMYNSAPKKDPSGNKKWLYKRFTFEEACNPITEHAPCVCSRGLQWTSPGQGKSPLRCSVKELAALQGLGGLNMEGVSDSALKKGVINALPPCIMTQILSLTKTTS
jgi:site-specific DNA-cytosine methylase